MYLFCNLPDHPKIHRLEVIDSSSLPTNYSLEHQQKTLSKVFLDISLWKVFKGECPFFNSNQPYIVPSTY